MANPYYIEREIEREERESHLPALIVGMCYGLGVGVVFGMLAGFFFAKGGI